MLRAPLLTFVLLAWPLATQAQTQASCTFNVFPLKTTIKLSDGSSVFLQPLGIDDFSTVVGYGSSGTGGLIRWANGGVTHVGGTAELIARNDHGTDVGFDSKFRGVLVNGPTITPIVLDVNNTGVVPSGINNSGTVVGYYKEYVGGNHGFKRFNNGTTHTLDFPGEVRGTTKPAGINDLGAVVGTYRDTNGHLHGFIFHNGQWATLDYPQASDTVPVGITNGGQVIGNAYFLNGPRTLFLYENGTFKVISVPNSTMGSPILMSISPKQELILGRKTTGTTAGPGFIAKCQ